MYSFKCLYLLLAIDNNRPYIIGRLACAQQAVRHSANPNGGAPTVALCDAVRARRARARRLVAHIVRGVEAAVVRVPAAATGAGPAVLAVAALRAEAQPRVARASRTPWEGEGERREMAVYSVYKCPLTVER